MRQAVEGTCYVKAILLSCIPEQMWENFDSNKVVEGLTNVQADPLTQMKLVYISGTITITLVLWPLLKNAVNYAEFHCLLR